jgi:hypothetical protein
MTSLFMGNVVTTGVPASEEVVRQTATPYEHDAPAAMQSDAPEPGEVETDTNPDLGMVNRQLASKWLQGVTASPAWDWQVAETSVSTTMINEQVSTSGTAATREEAGDSSRNLSYAIGIEPVGDLVDGHKMTNNYFMRDQRGIQDTMNDSMSVPPGFDYTGQSGIAATGKDDARTAASPYNQYWNGGK